MITPVENGASGEVLINAMPDPKSRFLSQDSDVSYVNLQLGVEMTTAPRAPSVDKGLDHQVTSEMGEGE